MGNKASVSPSEGDNAETEERPRSHSRNSLQTIAEQKQNNATPTVEVDPPKRSSDGDNVLKTPESAYKTQARTEHIHEKVIDDRNDVSAPNPSAHEGNTPQAHGEFDDVCDNQQSRRTRALVHEKNANGWGVRLDDPIERGETGDDARKESERYVSYEATGSGSGTSSTGSYTRSTSNGSRGSSFDSSASDDTFFVPEEEMNDPDENGRALDCADVNRIVNAVLSIDPVELLVAPAQDPTGCTNKEPQSGEEREAFQQKIGKTKRSRPAKRHYIKDDTVRTLFGLVPFYGGGEGPMDQMVKAALASVGPNTIDVRDEEGNTLLILACQHCREDLVEPILAKGADPNAVNLVGSCALHYSCYADSLSVDTAETLLWRGADPATAETTYGCTPLHYAASAGDADICKLLLEHGAQPQIRDYYSYTAVKYAKDAGYDEIVEILEGERGGKEWGESQETQAVVDTRGGDIAPSGGLWIRYIDEETELGYVMNDETGESWWEIDLIAAAKDFISGTPPAGPDTARNKTTPDPPPLGVREWLVQGQVRSWLMTIFSRFDPLRLLEVDQVMQMGKEDFKGMLEALLVHYGVKDVDFLRKSLPPKLESLGISSLIPTVDQPGVIDEKRTTEANQTQEVTVELNVPSSQQSLNCADSCAALRAEADKIIQGAILKQQMDLTEERNRQKAVVDKQESTMTTLQDMMTKRTTATDCAKQVTEEATRTVEKLQSTLVEDSAEQTSTDNLVEEMKVLKARVVAERMRSSHIAQALEVSKGSAEERNAKQLALEEERRARLEKLKLENDQKVAQLRAGCAKDLNEAKEAWKAERIDLERAMTEEIEQAKQLLKENITGAANVLSDAAETTKSAMDAVRQATIRVDEAKAWMRGNEELCNSSQQIDQTNKQLHTSLRREMERAKQLHNQIEDTKGQTRIYARVRPLDSLEKEAGCKEVCLKDGKKQLAFLNAARQHWTYTNVFQISLAEGFTTAEEQAQIYREVSGLGISLADGHSVFLMSAGAAGSGKTLTLIGDPEEAKALGGFFPALPPTDKSAGGAMGHMASGDCGEMKRSSKEKGKRSSNISIELPPENSGCRGDLAVSTTPLAGIIPRLMAEVFATLSHRNVQSAFVVWVNAAYVSNMARPDDGEAVENLLSPPTLSENLPTKRVEDGRNGKRNFQPPPPAPPHDRLWGHAIEVSSAREAMLILESARSRAAPETQTESHRRKTGHFLSRVGVKVVNRSTCEESISEMVTVELSEERPGDSWPTALAELVRDHASTTGLAKENEADGVLGMIRGCLRDTSKVVTFLCVSPADNQAEKTERTLKFGEGCESSEKDGASQLRDLKKELTRLKKESTAFKRMAPSQLPRPAGGRRP